MANAVSPVSMPTGTPLAAPVYLVINDGTVVSTATGVPVNVVAGTISAENPSVGVLGSAIPADATLLGGSDGTNLQQLLVESNTNRNLRVALYNGTTEAGIASSTGTNSNQASQLVAGAYQEIAGQGTGVVNGINTDLIPSTDVSAYRAWSLHITGTWSGTLSFQGSNDGVNFVLVVARTSPANSGEITTTTTNNMFLGNVAYRYFRVRMTSYASNASLAGTLELYTYPVQYGLTVNAYQQGTWTVQPGNTPNTSPWLWARSTVAAYSRASAASTTNGNSGDIAVGPYTEISIDINTTAQTGTNPTVQFIYSRKAADGIYYALWQSAVLTAATNTVSTSIGAGMAYNQSLGVTGQLSWTFGGTATPGFTFSINIQGK